VSTAAAEAATRYQHTFDGRADQIASELAANAVLHSVSAGEFFTVRCQARPGHVWIEVEDLGGPWQPGPPGDRPHGLDIVHALAGPGNWGTRTTSEGDRIVWARLQLPEAVPR
jgi:anti-sigma regulatory factor (Ser/Thr protein kinase)